MGNGDSTGDPIRDHDHKMSLLLERCRLRGIKLNAGKVAVNKTSVSYIGHVLSPEGVKADPSKVEATVNMKRPTDMNGVRRIMGTVNYLAKFLPR